MYRVKTREEFVGEFGADWKRHVGYDWNYDMDKLFGRELNPVQLQKFENFGYTSMDGWSMHKNMIVEDPIIEF